VEALQIKGEEPAGKYGEKSIATARRVPLPACDEPEEREGDDTTEERDNCR
jgi:hypothetical protein